MSNNGRVVFFYKLLINVFINYFIVRLVFDTLEINNTVFLSLLVIFATAVSILVVHIFFEKTLVLALLLSILFVFGGYFYYFKNVIYTQFLYRVDDFIKWATRFISGLTFIYEGYLYILIIIIVFLISSITYILVFRTKRTYPLIIIGTILFLYRWFLFLDRAIIYYLFYILFVLQLYSYRVYVEKKKSWLKEINNIRKDIFYRWVIYSTIVIVIIVSTVSLLPKNFSPITWRWLDDKMQERFPQLTEWRNTRKSSGSYGSTLRFNLSFTQYQNSVRRLGGPIEQDNILIMRVTSQEPVYLRGAVNDFYTGSYWKSTSDIFHQQIANTDISFLDANEMEGKNIVYTIEHINLTTSTIFNSYIPQKVSIDDKTYYATNELELFSGKILLKNQKYKVVSVKKDLDYNTITSSTYINRDEHEKYLQLPNILPDRVVKLAEKLTRGYPSDYQKVRALVDYLRNNYEYTLTPPETPYNRDFIDYFLFDLKKGYCTYFASSLAILTRSIGIPSRYVEGFVTPKDKQSGAYNVYSSNAHAWTEVYIEGFGWMTFEATPAYEDITYEDYEEEAEAEIIEEDSFREQNDYTNYGYQMKNKMLEDILLNEEEAPVRSNANTKGDSKIYLLGIIIFILIISSRILYSHIKINKIIKSDYNNCKEKGIMNYYSLIFNLFRLINKGKRKDETSYEYCERIEGKMGNNMKGFTEVTYIFNKSRYGREEVTQQELEKVKAYFLKCEEYVKSKIGVLKFIFLKYIIMNVYNTKAKG